MVSMAYHIRKAFQQVARDGAAAVSAMHRFLTTKRPKMEVLPEESCAFSLCVDSLTAFLRVHWRHTRDDGEVTWQAIVVDEAPLHGEAQVFRLRSCIMNALDWSRQELLAVIHKALEPPQGDGITPPTSVDARPAKRPKNNAT